MPSLQGVKKDNNCNNNRRPLLARSLTHTASGWAPGGWAALRWICLEERRPAVMDGAHICIYRGGPREQCTQGTRRHSSVCCCCCCCWNNSHTCSQEAELCLVRSTSFFLPVHNHAKFMRPMYSNCSNNVSLCGQWAPPVREGSLLVTSAVR